MGLGLMGKMGKMGKMGMMGMMEIWRMESCMNQDFFLLAFTEWFLVPRKILLKLSSL